MRWCWREYRVVALYDDDSPSLVRGFYYRFWGIQTRNWQLGARRVIDK